MVWFFLDNDYLLGQARWYVLTEARGVDPMTRDESKSCHKNRYYVARDPGLDALPNALTTYKQPYTQQAAPWRPDRKKIIEVMKLNSGIT